MQLPDTPTPWRRNAATWALLWSLALIALALLLHARANPWQLRLLIPSGYDEQSYENVGYGPEITCRAD